MSPVHTLGVGPVYYDGSCTYSIGVGPVLVL